MEYKKQEPSDSDIEKRYEELKLKKNPTEAEQYMQINYGFTVLHIKTKDQIERIYSKIGDLKKQVSKITKWAIILFLIAILKNEILFIISSTYYWIVSLILYLISGFPKLSPDNAYIVVITIIIAIVMVAIGILGFFIGKKSRK